MANWKKIIVSGSTAEFNVISASGDILPVSDNISSLGSAGQEFKDLFIDGTANIDSLVADTANIDAGTVDGITSLTAAGNLDIGSHDFRARKLTADNQTSGNVTIYGTNGLLTEDSDLTFTGATLSATNLTTTGTIKNMALVSGSSVSTGSFGRLQGVEFHGDGHNIKTTLPRSPGIVTSSAQLAADISGSFNKGFVFTTTSSTQRQEVIFLVLVWT